MGFVENLVENTDLVSTSKEDVFGLFKACFCFFLTTAIREKPRDHVVVSLKWIKKVLKSNEMCAEWTLT